MLSANNNYVHFTAKLSQLHCYKSESVLLWVFRLLYTRMGVLERVKTVYKTLQADFDVIQCMSRFPMVMEF